ncbi:MAG: thymidine kinase [Chloroherpetonaceae bacterium]|nr:thymidine kinase [Chloroherpetonaceae bacterium]MDW8020760.1 thymidine kinase [Chloroherpetonaceae bacterium]
MRQLYYKPKAKPTRPKALTGRVEVIAGCMFSGKSEELIRRLRRAQIAKLNVAIFKPVIDTRYSADEIVSHSALKLASISVSHSQEILLRSAEADVVGIDEAQFFDMGIVDVCEALANDGKRVIVAGLDLDYRGKPFGPMPFLMAIAEEVTKTLAVCMKSGLPASRTQRLADSNQLILIGHSNLYEARHRAYFEPPPEANTL